MANHCEPTDSYLVGTPAHVQTHTMLEKTRGRPLAWKSDTIQPPIRGDHMIPIALRHLRLPVLLGLVMQCAGCSTQRPGRGPPWDEGFEPHQGTDLSEPPPEFEFDQRAQVGAFSPVPASRRTSTGAVELASRYRTPPLKPPLSPRQPPWPPRLSAPRHRTSFRPPNHGSARSTKHSPLQARVECPILYPP